ncbi:RCC1 domain-containing protein (plasmid) [Streptomyces sp. BI20]|uniref:RCC1 domain-containing protein n=1 Tax=Streptomyces sp. BI20 TaxID=3403460 RepID=UPI003C77D00C
MLTPGSVLAWGAGASGQLGRGTRTEVNPDPAPVLDLPAADVLRIAVGGVTPDNGFALALRRDGRVLAWGENLNGQLGDGTTADRSRPAPVDRLDGVVEIAAGGAHALVLLHDGTVRTWGDNAHGQLGAGVPGRDRTTPGPVAGLTGVRRIAAGGDFCLALLADGTVRAWGRGIHGQLGSGSRGGNKAPRPVRDLDGIVDLAAGTGHALALTAAGTVRSWGLGRHGQLGDGRRADSTTPVDVPGPTGVTSIATGAHHNHARAADGRVWAWGDDRYGQLLTDEEEFAPGWPRSRADRALPVEASRLRGCLAVDGGARHGVALFADSLTTWGDNRYGQLGDGTTTPGLRRLPATGFTHVAAGRGGGATYAL